MAKHIHIHVGSKAKDEKDPDTWEIRPQGDKFCIYRNGKCVEKDIDSKANAEHELSKWKARMGSKDAGETNSNVFVIKYATGEKRLPAGTGYEEAQRQAKATAARMGTVTLWRQGVKEATYTGDASNHLGEKEYYTYRRWKEARNVKASWARSIAH